MKPKYSAISLVSTICLTRWPRLLAVACSLGAVSLSPIASAASLTYDADTTPPVNDGVGVWDIATPNWFDGANDVVWPNGLADTATFGAGGTIASAAAGTVTVGTVNVGTISFAQTTTNGYTLATGTITLGTGITKTSTLTNTISAKISGTAGLAFTGLLNAGTGVTLSGANDYTGITTISTGGRITAGNATALGSNATASASTLGTDYTQVNSGATAAVTSTTAEAFLINGNGSAATGNPPGALRLSNGITLESLVQLGSDASLTGNFSGTNIISGDVDLGAFTLGVGNGNNAITVTISGLVIGAPGSFGVSDGGGTNVVNLTNAGNSYAGTSRVSGGGTIGLGGDLVLGGSTLSFTGGGVRSTDATARTIANPITFTGAGATTSTFGPAPATPAPTQTGTLNFTSTATAALGAVTRTLSTNVETTIAAELSGGGALTKTGAATLFLTNTVSPRTGTTTINAGILNVAQLADGGAVSSIGASASTASTLVFGGGTLQYNGPFAQMTNRLFTMAPSSAGPSARSTIDASGSDPSASLVFTNPGNIAQNDLVRSATLPITSTTLTLSTTADLKVGATVTGPNIAAGTTIASIPTATTIGLSQASTNLAAATSNLTFGSVDRTLVLTGNNTGANSLAGVLRDRSATAKLSLSKSGIGTWALSGLNTYTGNTTVTDGILQIDAPVLANTADVIIGTTGKLNLNFTESGGQVQDVVNKLTIDGVEQAVGTTYGATGSGAAVIDDIHFAGTGVLSVSPGGSENYVTWLATKFTAVELLDPTISGPGADPDGDGLGNLLEFVVGTEPKTAEQGKGPVYSTPGNFPTITLVAKTSSLADATVVGESGTTLVSWPDTMPLLSSTANTPAVGQTTLVFRSLVPFSATPQRFYRLELTAP